MDWDSDDFQLPPLIESDESDEEEEYIEHILHLDASVDDSSWEIQKCSSPQNEETSGENSEINEESNMEFELQTVLECGEVLPPDLEFLSKNLKPDDGKPRNLRAEVWICPDCGESHEPSKNLVADLQAYKCRLCQRQNHTAYSWSLTRAKLNGVSLNFTRIFMQIDREICIVYAFLNLCDMMRRVRGAKRGWDEATPLDQELMMIFYKETCGFDLESQRVVLAIGGRNPHIEIMLETAVMYGVPYSSITRFDHYFLKKAGQKLCIPKRTLKVKNWYRIDHWDVGRMTRLLAHGIPLLAVVPLGKCFEELPKGAVYHAPEGIECYGKEKDLKNLCVTHAVVIHGSAIAMPECDLSQPGDEGVHSEAVYFECRNSYGTEAHPSWDGNSHGTKARPRRDSKREGADFFVWAADVLGDVYAITLLDFDD